MAKLLLFVVLAALTIAVITGVRFGDSCPPNCRETQCSFLGCLDCDLGFCHYSEEGTGKFTCVKKCPAGMYCESTHRLCVNDE
ncbi:proprotein convertase subtilisin/kexin type 6-like [Haliotis rubra]|uniref:proprotein convertase subtilisin/kexin type 6-like n=1 Tax=Haliotis rubra TaxID=36100 RepID=UPI001EE59A43|nr:proprotein convertase subtilisin/kexin type 6-like [Haliotis rubra]